MFKQLFNLFYSLRPSQWIKNLIIFIPLFFSKSFYNFDLLLLSIEIFFIFCIFVWATYILNDLKDRHIDVLHPVKSKRALASWALNPRFAFIVAILILIWILYYIFTSFNLIIFSLFLVYLLNSLIYSLYLKKIVILDVFIISFWFIIRVLIWILIINVEISSWLIILIFFGSLFFGYLKRYQELMLKNKHGISSRENLKGYDEKFLQHIISVLFSLILISYTFYTFQSVQSQYMIITVPLVMYWMIRFYYSVFFLWKIKEGIDSVLLKDIHIVITWIIYLITTFLILSN